LGYTRDEIRRPFTAKHLRESYSIVEAEVEEFKKSFTVGYLGEKCRTSEIDKKNFEPALKQILHEDPKQTAENQEKYPTYVNKLFKLLINEKLENKVKSDKEQQNGPWFKNLMKSIYEKTIGRIWNWIKKKT
jgi:hypothetical protein